MAHRILNSCTLMWLRNILTSECEFALLLKYFNQKNNHIAKSFVQERKRNIKLNKRNLSFCDVLSSSSSNYLMFQFLAKPLWKLFLSKHNLYRMERAVVSKDNVFETKSLSLKQDKMKCNFLTLPVWSVISPPEAEVQFICLVSWTALRLE